MPLKAGIYRIRFVPKNIKLPFEGGVYATSPVINATIRAEPLSPSPSGTQKWRVEPVEGKRDTYRIFLPEFGRARGVAAPPDLPVVPGWHAVPKGGLIEPVTLSTTIVEWVLNVVDEKHGVYIIAVPREVTAVSYFVAEENNLLYIRGYPVLLENAGSDVYPSWQFIAASGTD